MVHTFVLELKTNHRFHEDPRWGRRLAKFRDAGPGGDMDIAKINTRVVGSPGGPTENDIPSTVVYATKTNMDRAAINEAEWLKGGALGFQEWGTLTRG